MRPKSNKPRSEIFHRLTIELPIELFTALTEFCKDSAFNRTALIRLLIEKELKKK